MNDSLDIKMCSTSDLCGGAGLGAYRLLQGLLFLGANAQLFVQEKKSDDDHVRGIGGPAGRVLGQFFSCIDPLPKLFYPNRHRDAWSCGYLCNPFVPFKTFDQADIIHLHWINAGMVSIRAIGQLPSQSIVWTLHDSWPFTGGCHITYGCRKYEERCGDCPQLKSDTERDLSRKIWRYKHHNWHKKTIQIVAPSTWMASIVKASSLFRDFPVSVIPNGLNTHSFSPFEKLSARRRLGLPERTRLILFSAMGGVDNWNKGGNLLKDSLAELIKHGYADCKLVLCGNNKPIPKEFFHSECIDLGRVDDDNEKKYLYSAADVTVIPSHSENLPYVVMESMACGTPCVAFSVGGIPDIIDHQVNGYLAEPHDVKDFASGIAWVLSDTMRYRNLSYSAREKIIEHFCYIKVAKRYSDLYSAVYEASIT